MTREERARLLEVFELARPRLEAALEYSVGEFTIEDVKDMVMSEEAQLWHCDGYSGVTKIVCYPRRKVVLVHLAGGDLQALLNDAGAGGAIEKFAEIVGADGIEIQGRKGWVRALRDKGYSEKAVRVFRELRNE